MTTRKDGDKMDKNQAGVIQLGVDAEGILKVMPINGRLDSENNELLKSIDGTLKTLLTHFKLLTS